MGHAAHEGRIIDWVRVAGSAGVIDINRTRRRWRRRSASVGSHGVQKTGRLTSDCLQHLWQTVIFRFSVRWTSTFQANIQQRRQYDTTARYCARYVYHLRPADPSRSATNYLAAAWVQMTLRMLHHSYEGWNKDARTALLDHPGRRSKARVPCSSSVNSTRRRGLRVRVFRSSAFLRRLCCVRFFEW